MKYLFIFLLFFKFAFTNVFSEIINNIEVKNNNRITKETIITFGGIELGKDYSQQQLNDILLDLYSTNFFSDKSERTPSGSTIIMSLLAQVMPLLHKNS